jgi:hypothetical protein
MGSRYFPLNWKKYYSANLTLAALAKSDYMDMSTQGLTLHLSLGLTTFTSRPCIVLLQTSSGRAIRSSERMHELIAIQGFGVEVPDDELRCTCVQGPGSRQLKYFQCNLDSHANIGCL